MSKNTIADFIIKDKDSMSRLSEVKTELNSMIKNLNSIMLI